MERIEIHQSTIGDLEMCPARVGQKDVEGFTPIISEQALFGTILHKMIAMNLNGATADSIVLSGFKELVEKTVVDEFVSKGQEPDLELADGMVAELIRGFNLWQKQAPPIEPYLIEETMEARLAVFEEEDYEIVLVGTPDVFTQDHVLWDWKTSGRPWKDGKAEASIQIPLYIYLVEQNYDVDIRQGNFFIYNRGSEEWTLHETYPSEEFVDSSLARAIEYGRLMHAGIYPATPLVYKWGKPERGWYCSEQWCPAWKICPYKNLGI